jgi:hypothetical protein
MRWLWWFPGSLAALGALLVVLSVIRSVLTLPADVRDALNVLDGLAIFVANADPMLVVPAFTLCTVVLFLTAWWMHRTYAVASSGTLVPGVPSLTRAGPDMPIRELFLHIEPNILGDGEENPYLDIGRDILDRLAADQLGGWGRRVGGNGVLTRIAPDDWAEAEWTFMFFGEGPASREEIHVRIEGNEYRDVTFRRDEVVAIWPGPRPSPVDFSAWDQRETFALFEAAALWNSKTPVLPMTDSVRNRFKSLCEDMLDGQLRPIMPPDQLKRFDTLRNAHRVFEALALLKPSTEVARSDLIAFARARQKHPQFLFPEQRRI